MTDQLFAPGFKEAPWWWEAAEPAPPAAPPLPERAEIAIIEAYLPKQMDEVETKAAIDAAIAEAGAAGPKDMGKVIAVLKGAYAGRMDFAKASGLVKAALNAKA